ncbi:MAG: hypothetical protein PF549_01875 [Patescibacteria group bacterium]|jgi:5'(3')-deoxyribonucleotidase|nr:hypothetical protein [Patescibacteria group bacterium]
MMKIAIDIDDVLADFSSSFIKFQKERYNLDLNLLKDRLYRKDWIIDSGLSLQEGHKRVIEFVESDGTKNLKVVKGSREAMNKMKDKFKLIALTGRPASVSILTEEWLNKNFQNTFSSFLSTDAHMFSGSGYNKGEICIENGISLLIDDLPQYCLECVSVDVPTILFNQPHNQYFNEKEYPSITRINSWEEVANKLVPIFK